MEREPNGCLVLEHQKCSAGHDGDEDPIRRVAELHRPRPRQSALGVKREGILGGTTRYERRLATATRAFGDSAPVRTRVR